MNDLVPSNGQRENCNILICESPCFLMSLLLLQLSLTSCDGDVEIMKT